MVENLIGGLNVYDSNSSQPKKKCTKCKREYPATSEWFHYHRNAKDQLRPRCKRCRREAAVRYHAQNREESNKKGRARYAIQHPGSQTRGKRRRKAPQCYHDLAKMLGFRWLGPEVSSTNAKTWWQCSNGHQWEAQYNSLQTNQNGHRRGTGCPFCAGNAPKTPYDYHALAIKHGLAWVGPEASNVNAKTAWQCSAGHQWIAPYQRIQQGNGCPACVNMINGVRTSQIQIELSYLTGGELNYYAEGHYLDIALLYNDLKVCIEYDGWLYHRDRQDEDAQRDEILIAAGWRILRVKSSEKLPTTEQLDLAIDSLLDGANYTEIILEDWKH